MKIRTLTKILLRGYTADKIIDSQHMEHCIFFCMYIAYECYQWVSLYSKNLFFSIKLFLSFIH